MTMQMILIHCYKTVVVLSITTKTLMIEIYKMKNDLNPSVIDFIFEMRNNTSNLRNFKSLLRKEKEL